MSPEPSFQLKVCDPDGRASHVCPHLICADIGSKSASWRPGEGLLGGNRGQRHHRRYIRTLGCHGGQRGMLPLTQSRVGLWFSGLGFTD